MRKKGENNIKPPQGKSCDPLDEIMMSPLGLEVNTPAHAPLPRTSALAQASLRAATRGRAGGRRPKSKPADCGVGVAEFFPKGTTPSNPAWDTK